MGVLIYGPKETKNNEVDEKWTPERERQKGKVHRKLHYLRSDVLFLLLGL